MSTIEELQEQFENAGNAYHETAPLLEHNVEVAAIRLLAEHALSVNPQATHMLMESSDQGNHMCAPLHLAIGKDVVSEDEWDAYYEEHTDDMSDAASWLTWGHDSWEVFADAAHPYSNMRGGYYALDLRRIVAGDKGDSDD